VPRSFRNNVGDDLDPVPAFGLCGGAAALYLLAFVALRFRVGRTLGGGRLVAAIACALLWPVAVVVPALIALTLVAVVWAHYTRTRSSGGARPARRYVRGPLREGAQIKR
jgi:hypothetical protein